MIECLIFDSINTAITPVRLVKCNTHCFLSSLQSQHGSLYPQNPGCTDNQWLRICLQVAHNRVNGLDCGPYYGEVIFPATVMITNDPCPTHTMLTSSPTHPTLSPDSSTHLHHPIPSPNSVHQYLLPSHLVTCFACQSCTTCVTMSSTQLFANLLSNCSQVARWALPALGVTLS